MTMTVTMAGKGGTLPILAALATASFLSLTVWVLGGYIFLKYKGEAVRDLIAKLGGLYLLILSVQMIINGVSKIIFP
jgi:small neutral amino acid transporter SnatA (MarC family)